MFHPDSICPKAESTVAPDAGGPGRDPVDIEVDTENVDVDRLIFDPEYRARVREALNRKAGGLGSSRDGS